MGNEIDLVAIALNQLTDSRNPADVVSLAERRFGSATPAHRSPSSSAVTCPSRKAATESASSFSAQPKTRTRNSCTPQIQLTQRRFKARRKAVIANADGTPLRCQQLPDQSPRTRFLPNQRPYRERASIWTVRRYWDSNRHAPSSSSSSAK